MQKLQKAIEAVQLACKTIKTVPLVVNTKTDTSPVTLADYCSQAIITTMLSEDSFISEESTPDLDLKAQIDKLSPVAIKWDVFDKDPQSFGFFLDPIDGTKGFLRGDQYAVCLSYYDNGIQFSILGCPNLGFPTIESTTKGTLMVAIKDKGCFQSFLTDKWSIDTSLKCECKLLPTLAQSFESSHVDQSIINEFIAKNKITSIIRMDSQAKYVIVARGEVGFYARATPSSYTEKSWDHMAGILCINEANGKCTQFSNLPIPMAYKKELIVNGIVGCHKSYLLP